MNKDEILIIKPSYPVKKDNMITVYRNMLEQMKTGLVLIPFGYEVVTAPKDIEMKLGPDKDEEKVIHNAVTYICMADKNHHGMTADQIAQLLYDRAYRKGFEAGKEAKIEEKPEEESEEVKEIWCTECPYFEYVPDDMDDSWYGTRCYKDGHEANPSMYAVQSLHDDCPLKKKVSE